MAIKMEDFLEKQYAELGISKDVLDFGDKILGSLKERFGRIDEIAEYNQLKVIHAMQKCRVSEACLSGTAADHLRYACAGAGAHEQSPARR